MQLAKLLGLEVTDSSIEKWEKNQSRPTEAHRRQIINFLGFDPTNPDRRGVLTPPMFMICD
jgi:transcriptional regulator with XRE-family HTH domain